MTEAVPELSREAIAALDPQDMLGDVLMQPHQYADALWRVESARIEPRDRAEGMILCGMGGSAIGGDLAAAAFAGRARRPFSVVRDYTLPAWVGEHTLVVCASYSGNTEETLAAFAAAGAAGAPRIAITTGGELAAAAREAGVPVIGVPSGMQPRAAVAYMFVAALECAALAGVVPSLRPEIEAAGTLLGGLVGDWGPDAPEHAPPQALARRLAGTVPVIYGAGPTTAVAYRWKAQLNENALLPAFNSALPEADHNEICGWGPEAAAARLFAVLLDDAAVHPRTRRRIALTAQVLRPGAAGVEVVSAAGETPVERVAALVLFGDLVSVYTAVLAGTDPTPVEPIERFKAALAGV